MSGCAGRLGLHRSVNVDSDWCGVFASPSNRQERWFDTVNIVLVGKYTALQDSYMSVIKSLEHAAMRCQRKLVLEWVEASDLEHSQAVERPKEYHKAHQALCSAQ